MSSAEKEPMYSRNVSKSEEEFLREFEAELNEEDLDSFLNVFDDIELESETKEDLDSGDVQEESEGSPLDVFTQMELVMDDIPMESVPVESAPVKTTPIETTPIETTPMETSFSEAFSLGGVDLNSLLSETTGVASSDEPVPLTDEELALMELFPSVDEIQPLGGQAASAEQPAGDGSMEAMFAELFGADAVGGMSAPAPMGDSSETIDLSNMNEADLMSLLAGDDGLSDIGNMLSGNANIDDDVFAAFAEGEMSVPSADGEDEESGSKKKKKKKKKKDGKGGIFGGIIGFFKMLLDSEEDDEVIALNTSDGPTADMLSNENADILAAFQDVGEKPDKGDKGKKKKEKKKKEKKEKPKKEKKPKEPKPKKEKKPKVVDNTPPLPKGPVIAIWLMAVSLLALVMLGVNLISYSSPLSAAKEYFDKEEYANAYTELLGLEIKEKDTLFYNQAATLAAVDSELNAFEAFALMERHEQALDSLVCAAGRCKVNADNAEMYECQGQMQILQAEITNKLYEYYGMSFEEAMEIYESKSREEYTIALTKKLRSLGLVE